MPKKLPLITLFLWFFSYAAYGQEMQETYPQALTARQIMVLTVAKARENDQLKQDHLTYTEDYERKEFNYLDQLNSTERSTTVIGDKIRKLAGFDLRTGELLQILLDRDEFSLADVIQANNENPIVVLDFWPKPNREFKKTEDKFINRLRGKLTLNAADYSLLKVSARIPDSDQFNFRAWWGIFFATVYVENFKLDLEQINYRGIMVEKKIEVETKFHALNSTRTRKYHYQYRDYQYR